MSYFAQIPLMWGMDEMSHIFLINNRLKIVNNLCSCSSQIGTRAHGFTTPVPIPIRSMVSLLLSILLWSYVRLHVRGVKAMDKKYLKPVTKRRLYHQIGCSTIRIRFS